MLTVTVKTETGIVIRTLHTVNVTLTSLPAERKHVTTFVE